MFENWRRRRREAAAAVTLIARPAPESGEVEVKVTRPWSTWIAMASTLEAGFRAGSAPPFVPGRGAIWPIIASRIHDRVVHPHFPISDQDRLMVESGLAYIASGCFQYVLDGDVMFVHLHRSGDVAVTLGHPSGRLHDRPVRVWLGNYLEMLQLLAPVR